MIYMSFMQAHVSFLHHRILGILITDMEQKARAEYDHLTLLCLSGFRYRYLICPTEHVFSTNELASRIP